MYFRSLNNEDLAQLYSTFIEGFKGYFVNMQMSEDAFYKRFFQNIRVDLDYSGALFSKTGTMAAFMLHAYHITDKKIAYNAGTAVLPNYRGQGVATLLYEKMLLHLQQKKVEQVQLEVITENKAAIRLYEKVGFQKKRTLAVYQTSHIKYPTTTNKHIHPIQQLPLTTALKDYQDFIPAWTCDLAKINTSDPIYYCCVYLDGNLPKAYGMVEIHTGQLLFLGVHKECRQQGIGRIIYQHLAQKSKSTIRVLNIPKTASNYHNFLIKMGQEVFIRQYEMHYLV